MRTAVLVAWLVGAAFPLLGAHAAAQATPQSPEPVDAVHETDAGVSMSTAPPRPSPPSSAAHVRAALARYRREPTIAAVVRAAQFAMAHSPTASMASRARAAGWIPTVGLSARRGQAVDLSSSAALASEQGLRLSTGDDLSLTASLSFELDRLLFRREEIGIVREARAERAGRTDRIREIVRLYFVRRRLQLERDLGVGDPAAQALGIAEAEALLDAFTNGVFGRMLRTSGSRR